MVRDEDGYFFQDLGDGFLVAAGQAKLENKFEHFAVVIEVEAQLYKILDIDHDWLLGICSTLFTQERDDDKSFMVF